MCGRDGVCAPQGGHRRADGATFGEVWRADGTASGEVWRADGAASGGVVRGWDSARAPPKGERVGRWRAPLSKVERGARACQRAYAMPRACLAAMRAKVAVRPALMPVKLLG